MENRLETLRDEIDKLVLKENSDHLRIFITHMYGVARFCSLLAIKRKLNIELAATCGMLHDIYYMTGGSSCDHAAKGAVQAESILKAMNTYTDDEITLVTTAISHHSDKSIVQGPYDELLKDADVMDHCLYNVDDPIPEREAARFHNLLAEFGVDQSQIIDYIG